MLAVSDTVGRWACYAVTLQSHTPHIFPLVMQGLKFSYDKAAMNLKVSGTYSMQK